MDTPKLLMALAIVTVMISCNHQQPSAEADSEAAIEALLRARRSIRSFDTDRRLSQEQLLKIMWAGFGVTRPDGKRTAPSCINAQDIHLYLCQDDGVFEYDAQANALKRVAHTDIRPTIASHNENILTVPTILLVSDQTPFGRFGQAQADIYSAMDAGVVSQNISLYCTAANIATVCCAPPIDAQAVRQALSLPHTMKPLIYHPVGYER